MWLSEVCALHILSDRHSPHSTLDSTAQCSLLNLQPGAFHMQRRVVPSDDMRLERAVSGVGLGTRRALPAHTHTPHRGPRLRSNLGRGGSETCIGGVQTTAGRPAVCTQPEVSCRPLRRHACMPPSLDLRRGAHAGGDRVWVRVRVLVRAHLISGGMPIPAVIDATKCCLSTSLTQTIQPLSP